MGNRGSYRLADRYFDENVQEFLKLDLVDGGRSLQPSLSSLGNRLGGRMKLHLAPVETRLESIVRVLLTQVVTLRARVEQLEGQFPESVLYPLEVTPDPLAEGGNGAEGAREAASDGPDASDGEREPSGLPRAPDEAPSSGEAAKGSADGEAIAEAG